VYDPDLREEILDILQLQLSDNVKARVIDRADRNEYRRVESDIPVRSQLETYFYYKRRLDLA
jgi:polyphosphate kinase